MPKQTTKRGAEMEQAQVDAILAELAARPGQTAYDISLAVPVEQPGLGLVAQWAPLTLVLRLLGVLEKTGRVRMEPDPKGNRWYLTGQPETEETPNACP